jgi:Rod binding domain-containing protein
MQLAAPTLAATRAAAQKFEAQALGSLLAPMFETLSTKGPFGGGSAEAMWRPMLVSEFGRVMAEAGGIGLADAVLRTMLAAQEAGAPQGPSA